jgi:hypothetical protein
MPEKIGFRALKEMKKDIILEQKELCKKYGVPHCPSPSHLKVGISKNIRGGIVPLNGLRHPPEGDTTGWYVWAGEELSDDVDFFEPLHARHLSEWCPEIQKFIGLPPGWRFLKASNYEDVWYDESLLDV